MMRGVRFFGHGVRVSSVLMSLQNRKIRFVDTVYVDDDPSVVIEF